MGLNGACDVGIHGTIQAHTNKAALRPLPAIVLYAPSIHGMRGMIDDEMSWVLEERGGVAPGP
jgi:hypothetical protein